MSIWGRRDSGPPARDSEPPAEEAHESQAEAPGTPAATEVQEPTGAVAREPVVNEAQEPAASEPAVTEAPESTTEAVEPVMAGAQAPAGAEAQELAVPSAHESAAQSDAPDSGIIAQRWSEILVAFVDDPRSSVQMAAGAVDEAVDAFVNSVRARQRALSSSWQGTETGTEQLRTALLDYRKLWHQVRHLDLGDKAAAEGEH